MRLNNKVCVISGAGKGIGRETAKLFYEEGACLALITRTGEDFDSLKDELNYSDDRVLAIEGDVSDEKSICLFVEKTLEKFGRIDVLINNAGMRFRKPFLEMSTDEWNKVMNTNLTSIFVFCREIGNQMVKQKYGSIVNMSSIVGTHGLPELTAYGASKGGIITFTKCLALEFAPFGVRVNSISPGFCETSYTDNFKKNKKELYDFTIERTPLKRWGRSREVADACLFLATEESSYITGETLNVDGGRGAW